MNVKFLPYPARSRTTTLDVAQINIAIKPLNMLKFEFWYEFLLKLVRYNQHHKFQML